MPTKAEGLRFPHERTFLPRTKLAYVHLRNLLSDAKRDRAARVYGYVAIWLPEEVILLYLQEGEVVNATTTRDGRTYEVLAIADAVAHVPTEPEFGEVTFQEADDEQLACMFHAQTAPPIAWPGELADPRDPRALFPYLASTFFDGTVVLSIDLAMNYLVLRDGTVVRAFLADGQPGPVVERVRRLFLQETRRGQAEIRRWGVAPPLPAQAPPALLGAYSEIADALVRQLVHCGAESAPAVAEAARRQVAERFPALAAIGNGARLSHAVVDAATLTRAASTWVQEVLWAAPPQTCTPEELLRDITRERRHMLQSAGFYDALPWRVTW